MAYNKKNKLKRIIDIQNIYLDHSKNGVSPGYIYKEIIRPRYRISRSTFYAYLAINAKRELKLIKQKEEQNSQMSMF